MQQLCEASEEEFLEIMALVGMASKPLHVRRLQKTLQEWVSNPALFRAPIVPFAGPCPPSAQDGLMLSWSHGPNAPNPDEMLSQGPGGGLVRGPIDLPTGPNQLMSHSMPGMKPPSPSLSSPPTIPNLNGISHSKPGSSTCSLAKCGSMGNGAPPISMPGQLSSPMTSPSTAAPTSHHRLGWPQSPPPFTRPGSCPTVNPFNLDYGQPSSPNSLTPVLIESQIQRLEESADALVKSLPPFDNKPTPGKKRISKELEVKIKSSFVIYSKYLDAYFIYIVRDEFDG